MDPRGGRLPPYIRHVADQSKISPIIEFLRSSDMTVLLVAGCLVIVGLIAIGAMTLSDAPDGPSYYAAAFG